MKRIALLAASLLVSTGLVFADSSKDSDPKSAPPARAAKPKAKPPEKKTAATAPPSFEAELDELRGAVQAQQEQIQQLREELARRDEQMQQAQKSADAASARAAEASAKATEAATVSAEMKSTAASLNSSVSDLKASNEVLKSTVATEQADAKKITDEGSATIRYKGINITPGGFIAAETVFRNRASSADINTNFTGIPFPGNSLSKVTENNFSARQSRLTLLADTKVGSAKVTGYYEADFLGAGTTSNNRQSNSYVFRQRQLWANVTFDNGFSLTGGQQWSLVTESKKGIQNRQEAFPLQIDAQYIVGWAWQRAYGFRVVKDFGKFALGASIEGPQTTLGGRIAGFGGPALVSNFFLNAPGQGAGLLNQFDATGYTVNKAPDFLAKATLDPGWGHYEVVGILSTFRNRVYPCGAFPGVTPLPTGCASATSVTGATNDTRVGGGVGFTARFPIVAKKVDLAGHFQGGDGIGRYSSAQLSDVTFRPDGTLALIRSAAWLGSLEIHPTPNVDVYAYGGGEYAARTAYSYLTTAGNTAAVGYGSRLFNNSGCGTETFPGGPGTPGTGGSCAGDIRQIMEGTIGFWYKFYQGSKGRVQWGVQYSYLTKVGWSGSNNNSTTGTPPVLLPAVAPKAVDNMVFTSFRYYLP